MRMIMAVVPKSSGTLVLDALTNAGYTATYNETRGGMLRQSQLTLFIGVKESDVEQVLDLVKSHCKTESKVHYSQTPERIDPNEHPPIFTGGAVFFIWKLEQFEKC